MSKLPSVEPRMPSPLSRKNKGSNGTNGMDDLEKTMSRVAELVEQLHANVSSQHERELTTARLLGIAKARKETRVIIGSHGQAMPLFVSILRNGTLLAKVNVAATLSVLCRDEELRVKVLLGGCIPPLLSLLKSDVIDERKAAAEALYAVSSDGLSNDHVGVKIFVTEGVVPTLWEELNPKRYKQDKVVEGFVTGALRNLCGDKEGFWKVTLDAGGVDIVIRLLSSENPVSQSNAASLLARLVLAFHDSVTKIIESGAIVVLIRLLTDQKDVSIRASAAEALEALALKSAKARKSIIDNGGVSVLVGGIVAPSKESARGEEGEALQRHSMLALANICGGMSELILYLGELSQAPRLSAPVADIIGALAYVISVFEPSGDGEEVFEPMKIEGILVTLLKPRDNKAFQDRLFGAMASLYNNVYLSSGIDQSEAKFVLVGLITMTSGDAQEILIMSLIRLCSEGVSLWEALGKREGIHLLISSLGLASEQHQEYAVKMLLILTEQVDDSKWAITAAGGIPPLVRLIEIGSLKAGEDAACIFWKLCCHGEDIRACVETAGAIPALLLLLKDGGSKGQEASAKALMKLIRTPDSSTVNELMTLLLGDSPSSKTYVIEVLGHVLSVATHNDLVHKGSFGNKCLRSLARVVVSSNEKSREYAGLVLADLFKNREDILESLAKDEDVTPCIKIVTGKTYGIPPRSPRSPSSRLIKAKTRRKMSYCEGDIKSLIKTAKTSFIGSAENAMAALAYLLPDYKLAMEALSEGVVPAITRVLDEGSLEGKKNASHALRKLLKHFSIEEVLKIKSIDANAPGYVKRLIRALVDVIKKKPSRSSLEIEVRSPKGFRPKLAFRNKDDLDLPDSATDIGHAVAMWLLCIISSSHSKNKTIVNEVGGLEALHEKLASYTNSYQGWSEDKEEVWIGSLLASILFQDESVVYSPTIQEFIPLFAELLKSSDEMNVPFFSAQAIASLVNHGKKEINLAIANSGAIAGLTTVIGHLESSIPNLIALSEEFSLVKNPDQMILESLFRLEEVRVGSVARRTIGLLVDLLRPIPNRPGAPLFVVRLLTQIADGNDANKLLIAKAGALDALSKYLSLSPQDLTEAMISELLRILFINRHILCYESAFSCMNQLIAVLHLGSRNARLSAARALNELFDSESIRGSEASMQAVQPLADMLDTNLESEQKAALNALVKLTSDSSSKAAMLAEVEGNPLQILCKILASSNASLESKSRAAKLCGVIFGNARVIEMQIVSECVEPILRLMKSDKDIAAEAGVYAFERLLDYEQQVDITLGHDIVGMLVGLISGSNHRLIEASICALIKLAKDRTPRKLDMVNAGVIENCLGVLSTAPDSLCATIAELFRILTNSSAISKSLAAAKIVEPLFSVLLKTDLGLWGQHSALQALVNVLEKPKSLSSLKLSPSLVIETLMPFLESPSQDIQQLGTELLSLLLAQEHFKQDITTKTAVGPLVQLAGIGILDIQETAVKALESISLSWPKTVSDAGGIFELSKVVVQDDPLPPEALWESATSILCNLLRYDANYYFKVPVMALVRMLLSNSEETIIVALKALIVQEKADGSNAELMVESGCIDALLDLLRSHQCEEASGRLLEALFNNARVLETKAAKYAIAPLAQYLMDPLTRSEDCRLVAAIALGDLSQHEGLARASASVSACRALVYLLEVQPTDEMRTVAVCALQNFVMRSRTNRRAVAEAGGVAVIQELLLSPNSEIATQATLLVKFLFSNHTLQEYVSDELIRALTAALEKELSSTAAVNGEVLKTIQIVFTNFPKLHYSEATAHCIPHLVASLRTMNEATQDSVLTTLCLLKQSWPAMPLDLSRPQAMVAAEAIPILQKLIKTSPTSFHGRIESLLNGLPGCLTVTILRANNLKQTNAFCRLRIGNGPSRHTKAVSHSTSPEWKERFTWAFDVPPKGQILNIVCRSRSTFGKTTHGRVSIHVDKVVNEGVYNGLFSLVSHDNPKDGSSRTIEVEIAWSNLNSGESE